MFTTPKCSVMETQGLRPLPLPLEIGVGAQGRAGRGQTLDLSCQLLQFSMWVQDWSEHVMGGLRPPPSRRHQKRGSNGQGPRLRSQTASFKSGSTKPRDSEQVSPAAPQFLQLWNGNDNTYHTELLKGSTKIIHANPLEECMAQDKHSIHIRYCYYYFIRYLY